MFYGQGAGGAPTASAVLGDLVMAARNKFYGGRGPGESTYAELPIAPIGDTPTRYHVNLHVADRPGVLAAVAAESCRHSIRGAASRRVASGGRRRRRPARGRHPSCDRAALAETVAALSADWTPSPL